MSRFTLKTVCSGSDSARSRAALPTSTVPFSWKEMQLGTSAVPCSSRTTTGRPFSTYAARLNVVPKSIPTTCGVVMVWEQLPVESRKTSGSGRRTRRS